MRVRLDVVSRRRKHQKLPLPVESLFGKVPAGLDRQIREPYSLSVSTVVVAASFTVSGLRFMALILPPVYLFA